MKTRLTGGLAAAALLTAGLACQAGAAAAVDATAYPAALGFTPQEVAVVGDDVYVAGRTDDYVGYVAKVGGATTELGHDISAVDIAAQPDGESLMVLASGEQGQQGATIDTATMEATPAEPVDQAIDLLEADAGGVYGVRRDEQSALRLEVVGKAPVVLDDSAYGAAATSIGAVGSREWYVVGAPYDDDPQATLWSFDEKTGEPGTPVVLGAENAPDRDVWDVVADPGTGVVYALSSRDSQSGLNVIRDGKDTYYPLTGQSSRLALSPDGDTLYVTQGSGIYSFDTGHLTANPDSADDARSTSTESGYIQDIVTAEDGTVLAGAGTDLIAFSTPGTVTDLAATGEPDLPGYAKLTWSPPVNTGGVPADYLYYDVVVQDRAGGDPLVKHTFLTDLDYEELVPGHTYDVSVAVDTGLLRGAPQTMSFTATAESVARPDQVWIEGTAKVGSRLSLSYDGAWAAGTRLAYRWSANGATVSTTSTLTLTPALVGKRVTVSVTGTHEGASPATVTSGPVVVAKGTLAAAKPVVRGTAKVGKTLTATPGRWTAGTALRYAWKANGKAVKGATKASLKLTKALTGKKVTVVVTGTKAGYVTRSVSSAPTRPVKR